MSRPLPDHITDELRRHLLSCVEAIDGDEFTLKQTLITHNRNGSEPDVALDEDDNQWCHFLFWPEEEKARFRVRIDNLSKFFSKGATLAFSRFADYDSPCIRVIGLYENFPISLDLFLAPIVPSDNEWDDNATWDE